MVQKAFRILKTKDGYGVHMVFINERRELVMLDENPVKLQGRDLKDLKNLLKEAEKACDAITLEYGNIEFAPLNIVPDMEDGC